MTDPYKILGVSPNASDDEVKNAYRELAKKYHPDSYANNPLSDLAQEKMQEINEAYDQIMQTRRGKGSAQSGGYSSSSSQFADIRNLINQKRIAEAEELLDGVPQASRDAEWYFLKGSVFYSRGWLDQALSHFQTATNMNPGNQEYRAALNQLMYQRNGGMNGAPGGYRTGNGMGGCTPCDICTGLMCADCCCDAARCC